MATYASAADLAKAIPAETVVQLFDDDNDGTADADTITFFLDMAESVINSELEQLYRIPLTEPIPAVVKYITVFLAVAFAYDRHPEYVRAPGEKLYERAKMLLRDIRDGKTGLDVEGLPVPANEVISVRSGAADGEPPGMVFNGVGAMGDY